MSAFFKNLNTWMKNSLSKLLAQFSFFFCIISVFLSFSLIDLIARQDSASVARAKDRHNELYHRIAEQHAAIAAQREIERLTYEATSVANDVDDHRTY